MLSSCTKLVIQTQEQEGISYIIHCTNYTTLSSEKDGKVNPNAYYKDYAIHAPNIVINKDSAIVFYEGKVMVGQTKEFKITESSGKVSGEFVALINNGTNTLLYCSGNFFKLGKL